VSACLNICVPHASHGKVETMHRIPYRTFPVTKEMKRTVVRVLENGEYRPGGKEETQFEKEFSQYVGAKYAVAVSSGAGALHIAMSVLGIGPGDEVITAANGFTAAADCAVWVGARPVFAEMERGTFNIDPNEIAKKITPRTKAIIPVHMYGHPADMDPIMELAEKFDLPVIEDVAQAAGSKYKGKASGNIGDVSIFSFAGKNMNCYHEGGMLVTNDENYAEKAILYRHFGHHPEHFGAEQYVIGYNYSMNGWNAALGRMTLRAIDDWNTRRRRNAKRYDELLGGLSRIEIPTERDWAYHVYLHYVIRAERRDGLKRFLGKRGIDTGIHYPIPIPLQRPYREKFGFKEGMFPLSEEATSSVLSIPTRPTLTIQEIKYITDSIKEFYR